MRRALSGAAVAALVIAVGCGGDDPPGASPGGPDTPPDLLGPAGKGETAEACHAKSPTVFDDPSGKRLAAAYREHVPTELEVKQASIAWMIALSAARNEALLDIGNVDEIKPWFDAIAAKYPTTGADAYACGGDIPLTTRTFFGNGPRSCSDPCSPTAAELLTYLWQPIASLLAGGAGLVKIESMAIQVLGALEGGVSLSEALTGVSTQSTNDFVTSFANYLGTGGLLAAAAGELGLVIAAPEVLAGVAIVSGGLLLYKAIQKILHDARECVRWKRQHCGFGGYRGIASGSFLATGSGNQRTSQVDTKFSFHVYSTGSDVSGQSGTIGGDVSVFLLHHDVGAGQEGDCKLTIAPLSRKATVSGTWKRGKDGDVVQVLPQYTPPNFDYTAETTGCAHPTTIPQKVFFPPCAANFMNHRLDFVIPPNPADPESATFACHLFQLD